MKKLIHLSAGFYCSYRTLKSQIKFKKNWFYVCCDLKKKKNVNSAIQTMKNIFQDRMVGEKPRHSLDLFMKLMKTKLFLSLPFKHLQESWKYPVTLQ